jgi:hypothetical protein
MRSDDRRRWVRRVVLTGSVAGAQLLALAVFGRPAAAAPADELPVPTRGVQILDVRGEPFGYITTTDGHRWFPICPDGDPPAAGDVCGGTGAASSGTVPGTFEGLKFFEDPVDARCQVVSAHNDGTDPSDVVLPRKCFDYPLMFGVASRRILKQVVEDMGSKVGACPGRKVACDKDLAYWPRIGDHIDCAHLPADHIPAEVKSFAAGDPSKLDSVCRVLDSYVSHTPPSVAVAAAPAQALGPAAAALYTDGLGGRGTTTTDVEWGALFDAVPGLRTAVDVAACVVSPPECFSRWLGGWLVEGLRAELGLIKTAITNHGSIVGILSGRGYGQLYGTVGLISLWLVLILFLFSILGSVLRGDPWGILRSAGGVMTWGYTWSLALVATLGVIRLSDQLTDFFGRLGTGSTEQTVDRFAAVVNSGVPGGATVGTWTVVALGLVGVSAAGFQWALTLGRDAGIAVLVLGVPLALAFMAGGGQQRETPRRVVSLGLVIIFAKPVTALMFVLANVVMAGATGLSAFAVGVFVLLLSCFAPFTLYRLFGAGLVSAETSLLGGRGGGIVRTGADIMSAVDRARRSYSSSRPQPVYAGGGQPGGSRPGAGQAGGTAAGGAGRTGAGAAAGVAATAAVTAARGARQAATRAAEAGAAAGGRRGAGGPPVVSGVGQQGAGSRGPAAPVPAAVGPGRPPVESVSSTSRPASVPATPAERVPVAPQPPRRDDTDGRPRR